jgi:predicted  nucleic acid-binding Zn-ribbon protein
VALISAGGALGVALVGVLVELVRRQGHALSEVAEGVQVAREHVANTHDTNLRDDIDSLMHRLDRVLDAQEAHGRELAALREDIQHERRERLAVAERLDDHMAANAA